MDPVRFDALARVLSVPDSRRRVLGLLTVLPVGGGLLGLLKGEETEAAGRRKRRKKAHKHGRGRRRKHHKKKTCQADSLAQTCAGRCGAVSNNCQQAVDCGSCACDAGSCPDCTTCTGGVCTPCADCCDGAGVCQDGTTPAACGSSGTCDVCTGQEQCLGQTCVCVPDCAGKTCGDDGCGGTCGTCASDSNCVAGTCTPGRYVFVTTLRYSGNLGGLSGADATCTTVAGVAGLPGSYRAWLSDDTGSPSARMSQSALPYYLVTGTRVAENWAGLTSGTLLAPIGITEVGDPVQVSFTWSNTRTDGTLLVASGDCDSWTRGATPDGPSGRLGSSYNSDSRWTQLDELTCGFPAHLYCFQQG